MSFNIELTVIKTLDIVSILIISVLTIYMYEELLICLIMKIL